MLIHYLLLSGLKVFEQKLDSCLRQNPIATAVHEFPSLSAPIGDVRAVLFFKNTFLYILLFPVLIFLFQ